VSSRPLVGHRPNALLAALYDRLFRHITVDPAWAEAVRHAQSRGTVVYVLRNLSFIDFFALDYLVKQLELPAIRFANDLGLWVLDPMRGGGFDALKPASFRDDASDLRRALGIGASAALFLKRPPSLLERSKRGRIEGDAFLRTLMEVQRQSDEPIILVPQTFIWSKSTGETSPAAVDAVLGPTEWPGRLRSIAQFLANYRNVTLRAGEPVDLREFLVDQGGLESSTNDDTLVRRLTYMLLRRLERERRSIIGPQRKPADRMREDVMRSPKLRQVIADMAGEGEAAQETLRKRANQMLAKMEATLDMSGVAAFGAAFETAAKRMYSAVDIDFKGIERLRECAKDGVLVLLPSHKSHVDYIVMSWICYNHHLPVPLIAAGDNLSFFPMGLIFRRCGAFFIRRSFKGDRLYGAVVDAYLRRLIKDGSTLEFFVEGGRSRTGKLLPPKLGLLSMVVDGALANAGRPVYFCPISIGYERIVETDSFVRELVGGEKKEENVGNLLESADKVTGRYGRLDVQFGEPLTLEQIAQELGEGHADMSQLSPGKRRALVTRLAHRVTQRINEATSVLPGALVATVLLSHPRRGMGHAELLATAQRLTVWLGKRGARFGATLVRSPDALELSEAAITEALDLYAKSKLLEIHRPDSVPGGKGGRPRAGEGAIYVVPPEARLSLEIAKNHIVHFFVARSLVACAIFASPSLPTTVDALRDRVRALSRLFKHEFQFRADAPFEAIFDEELAALLADGLLERQGDALRIPSDTASTELALFAALLRPFIEGYRVAARGLTLLLKSPLSTKELAKRCVPIGRRMFLAGEIECPEAVMTPLFETAVQSFVDQAYIQRQESKLVLVESFASQEAVKAIELRVASMQGKRAQPLAAAE
jgi:glycerol-3-phosphate O-acyltransferase